ncbi:MAG: endonuclease domain-containing protein, partial [Acidimicrobiales bacterium]
MRGFGPAESFRYAGLDLDPVAGVLACRYELDGQAFEERVASPGGDWSAPAAAEAARLVYLLAGVSYYKAGAPPVVDLGDTPLRDGDLRLLRPFYVEGLGEFAHRSGLDLSGLRFEGGAPAGPPVPLPPAAAGRPLVPFGGGIDSIVTVEAVRALAPGASLFVLSREGDRFAAVEDAAAAAGLPIARATRRLDDAILASSSRGWLNGHVPVTGILSSIALLVAVLHGHDAVVMSNEWSASVGNAGGVNHQWSKGWAFEQALRAHLARSFAPVAPEYFSFLRPWSELWVARRFAELDRYHAVFRSCNRAFALDPARRLGQWCGECDKCCFVDLILAPWLPAARLADVWGGHEPLGDPARAAQFRTLVGLSGDLKPWECVGDVGECAAAAALAAGRPDRAGPPLRQARAAARGPAPAH